MLDLERHLKTAVREVLPIFLAVSVLVAGALLWLNHQQAEDAGASLGEESAETLRVAGLLSPDPQAPLDTAFALISPAEAAAAPVAERFDLPMGSEHGALTYNAQPFLTTRHLGDDLNGIGGWDSDLGDPVYAVGSGLVLYAGWPADGWGRVVMVQHRLPSGPAVQSFYAHLESMAVAPGQLVRRGQVIGTVGKGNGQYLAHLHFELRGHVTAHAGAGYADGPMGRLPGERWLKRFRGAPDNQLDPAPEGDSAVDREAVSWEINGPAGTEPANSGSGELAPGDAPSMEGGDSEREGARELRQ